MQIIIKNVLKMLNQLNIINEKYESSAISLSEESDRFNAHNLSPVTVNDNNAYNRNHNTNSHNHEHYHQTLRKYNENYNQQKESMNDVIKSTVEN